MTDQHVCFFSMEEQGAYHKEYETNLKIFENTFHTIEMTKDASIFMKAIFQIRNCAGGEREDVGRI